MCIGDIILEYDRTRVASVIRRSIVILGLRAMRTDTTVSNLFFVMRVAKRLSRKVSSQIMKEYIRR
jgi:hypothetical protein